MTTATAQPLVWHTDFDSACREAAQRDRQVLLVFSGSDWCRPCIQLAREVWDHPAFAKADAYVCVLADFPQGRRRRPSAAQAAHNEALAARYNPEGEFPLVLILDPQGQVLAQTGYRPGGAAAYLAHLRALVPPPDAQR
ncbi:MAG: hypothetical protein OHK0039_19560 [Bacteroidia bacterium]